MWAVEHSEPELTFLEVRFAAASWCMMGNQGMHTHHASQISLGLFHDDGSGGWHTAGKLLASKAGQGRVGNRPHRFWLGRAYSCQEGEHPSASLSPVTLCAQHEPFTPEPLSSVHFPWSVLSSSCCLPQFGKRFSYVVPNCG